MERAGGREVAVERGIIECGLAGGRCGGGWEGEGGIVKDGIESDLHGEESQ